MPLSKKQKIYLEDVKKFTPDQIEELENMGMSYDNIIIFQKSMKKYLKVNPETDFLDPSLRMTNYEMMKDIENNSDILDEEGNLIQEEFDELINTYNETKTSDSDEDDVNGTDYLLSILNLTRQQKDFFDMIQLDYEDIYKLQCVMRRYLELQPVEPVINPNLMIVNQEIMNKFRDNREYLLTEGLINSANFSEFINNLEDFILKTTKAKRMGQINSGGKYMRKTNKKRKIKTNKKKKQLTRRKLR